MSRALLRPAAAVALALATALTAAACGSDGGAATGGADETGGARPSASTADGTHPVKHFRGETAVPDHPQRVVVLDTDALDSAVTLGVTPVGATTVAAGAPLPDYLPADKVKGITAVGTIGEPNLEAIAALKPDLILSSQVRDEKRYDELSKIAPTVFTETTGPVWKQNFDLHAEALGRQAEARQVEAAYRNRIQDLVGRLGGAAKVKATTVEMARFVEGAPTRLYLNDTFVGSIFKDLGVGRPANQDKDGFSLEISPEQVDQADADVIFWSTYGDAVKSNQKKITESPLWRNLTAVREKRAYPVDDNLWMLGIGYTGAGRILDEIQRDLLG
ncbi:ABC transporter substrate-binding protein [Peterkaempfera bronchialis]|uniref:Iron-siderophore ABC transporter substrate-binding protein n=1 Tax=Peterkaempfera bronchialis TaxID=2126346 RepID=A0A345T3F7_9ACTN|nr:iron-siderophore ABC transporter substrate-binding protein [Peterkaempfera bronchialis]AXI80512.1 iron-siderophore ABC transporter substrate-binding protein [Peterkaempfera bronchialis]